MTLSLRRFVAPVVATLTVLISTAAQAAFTLTVTNPLTPLVYTAGGTTITLTPDSNQTFSGSTNANVFDVTASSTTAAPAFDTGSFMFTEVFTLATVGGGPTASFVFTGTLVLTQGSMGGILSSVTNTNISTSNAAGFNVSFAGYAAPSPSSAGSSGSVGNISLQILAPAAVPEPTSLVMLCLGLIGTAGFATRRRVA